MKLNEIFGTRSMKRSTSRAASYVPPLIREFAGDTPAEEPEGLKPNQWNELRDPSRLACTFEFDDPHILRRFVTEVLDFQEDAQHHGTLLIDAMTVHVEVWTHDINDVTELDREYAAELIDIYSDVMGVYSNV
jgi:pterin-4a-carbinolamine dehydratase